LDHKIQNKWSKWKGYHRLFVTAKSVPSSKANFIIQLCTVENVENVKEI